MITVEFYWSKMSIQYSFNSDTSGISNRPILVVVIQVTFSHKQHATDYKVRSRFIRTSFGKSWLHK